jgi:predicted Zn finger-like uncharacterized protein
MATMEITCKKCNTVYSMSEERIPIGGAKTRCKKCNTEIIIKSKADKIYYDIKNGATAKQIIKKHSISLDELKSLVISFNIIINFVGL